jgi:hypothetical protein
MTKVELGALVRIGQFRRDECSSAAPSYRSFGTTRFVIPEETSALRVPARAHHARVRSERGADRSSSTEVFPDFTPSSVRCAS